MHVLHELEVGRDQASWAKRRDSLTYRTSGLATLAALPQRVFFLLSEWNRDLIGIYDTTVVIDHLLVQRES